MRWLDWKDITTERCMFVSHPKKEHAHDFANANNAMTSVLLRCNNNVLWGLEGSSLFYCTCCASKSTQKDVKEKYASSAEKVRKNLMEKQKQKFQQQQDQDQLEPSESMDDTNITN